MKQNVIGLKKKHNFYLEVFVHLLITDTTSRLKKIKKCLQGLEKIINKSDLIYLCRTIQEI